MNNIHNPNCDGGYCVSETGEVRVLPTGGDGNAILCRSCFAHEMNWRRERNMELAKENRFQLPRWTDLKVYQS
jgi:hypothetical protein